MSIKTHVILLNCFDSAIAGSGPANFQTSTNFVYTGAQLCCTLFQFVPSLRGVTVQRIQFVREGLKWLISVMHLTTSYTDSSN